MQPFPLGQPRHGAILTNELESRLELLELREEPCYLLKVAATAQHSILPDRFSLDVPTPCWTARSALPSRGCIRRRRRVGPADAKNLGAQVQTADRAARGHHRETVSRSRRKRPEDFRPPTGGNAAPRASDQFPDRLLKASAALYPFISVTYVAARVPGLQYPCGCRKE
jgi:hypothetical protein